MFFLKKNIIIFNPLEQFEINTPLWYFSNFFSNITKITADMNSNLVFNQNNLYTQSGIDNSDNFVYFLILITVSGFDIKLLCE